MRIIAALVVALSVLVLGLSAGGLSPVPWYAPLSGLVLATVVWRSAEISIFLRTFILMYAIGFLLILSTVTLDGAGIWPETLKPFLAPAFMATASAAFAAMVYGVGHLNVIRTIAHLADPYFHSTAPAGNSFGGFGRLFGTEGRAAIAMLCVIIAGNFVQVALTIRLNIWYRDLFDALEKKDAGAFWVQIWWVFVPLLVIWIIFQMIDLITDELFHIRWRTFMTEMYADRWLRNATHYKMSLLGTGTDNPDQRISVDIRSFITSTMTLSVRLLTQAATLVSFTVILWSLSRGFTLPGTDMVVPGFLVWVALAYSLIGTIVTHFIGRPLIKLDFLQERYEANFRFGLARLREYGEQVALLRGAEVEHRSLLRQFADIVSNYIALLIRRLKLIGFTFSWQQISVAFPYILMGPYYFVGKITLGQMQQGASAFGRVEGALSFFISSYQSLAGYKAVIDRLVTFNDAMSRAEHAGSGFTAVKPADGIVLDGMKVALPNGAPILSVEKLALAKGKTTLVTGPSGSGKSTLFRALAGVWPYVDAPAGVPAAGEVMLLPQRPYLPIGPLRDAVTYPAAHDAYSDGEIRQALQAVNLDKFAGLLDETDNWQQRLSGGEAQRIAIARAILAKPQWLFLDEATSALDEPNEAEVYKVLKQHLPGASVVSIGHRSSLVPYHDARVELAPGADGLFTPRALIS